ncbi:hypothetical protein ACFQJD_15135 [Haloplanus sp. GCM10025708]|uniref:hypothetical protein n=1 Tax=Haloplanus sp. GCM10025708 TaxID=3252679 RepID=UPI0036161950
MGLRRFAFASSVSAGRLAVRFASRASYGTLSVGARFVLAVDGSASAAPPRTGGTFRRR